MAKADGPLRLGPSDNDLLIEDEPFSIMLSAQLVSKSLRPMHAEGSKHASGGSNAFRFTWVWH
jgi:hypothetical protein